VDYLPLFLRLTDRPVLVVGGGAVAARKVKLLLEARARVRVVAPELVAEVAALAVAGAVTHSAGVFEPAQLDGVCLAVAATDDAEVNAAVAAAGEAHGIWVNVVDDTERSAVIVPAIVDRSPLVVAISSGGAAPMLATAVRARIEALLEPWLGRLAAYAHRLRARVRETLVDVGERRRFWRRVFSGPVAHAIANGREAQANAVLVRELRHAAADPIRGRVLLVGAGPGNPELLTLRALRALGEADIVLHDRLVPAAILALGRRDAEYIAVGKRHGAADEVQREIIALMREHALAGRTVVRLKGGDPLIFGRAEEELRALRESGLDFEIVPGVTAALGCAAYAGIPLTARGGSDAVTLVTAAHCGSDREPDWSALGAGNETLVFYMGVAALAHTCRKLIAHGRGTDLPAALIERGSLPEQRVLLGTLATLANAAQQLRFAAPALLIVGEQAARARDFDWFGAAPIEGDAADPMSRAA
jgi:uroporphyrin-III C-methyltransferase/precorrin-2 dehydrogenase/sirohydrochlorin ferrochelatase